MKKLTQTEMIDKAYDDLYRPIKITIIILFIILIALLFALTSCSDAQQAAEDCIDSTSDCTATVTIDDTPTDDDGTPPTDDDATTDTPADPEPIEDEPIDDGDIRIVIIVDDPPTFTPLFVLQIDNSVYLSDTNERHLLMTGTIDKAAPGDGDTPGLWLINNQLLTLDATPDAITLDHTPTQARQTPGALYTCVEIDPATASAAGAQSEFYTEFFIDSLSQGHWVNNQMRCTDIVSAGGYTFAVSETGALTQIDGPATTPLYILDGEFVTHNLDSVNNRLDFNSSTESYTMNFLTAASQWIKHDSGGAVSYYSETGYIWDTTNGLQELVTALSDFNTDPRPIALPFGQAPTLISAGTRDGLIYWIEGNTGLLIEYDPINDAITTPYRLYSGDGTRATGTQHRDTLRPAVIAEYVYFSYGGILKRLDLDTGFFDEVYSGEATLFLID